MKASKMLIATLKEAPNEAIIDSHVLMLRAGMIRKLVAGVYNYLPIGLRTLHKIENIIREEMDYSGAQEILSSAVQPKELWEESGRWQKYGPELMRFKDRHERDFCLGPTHEEIFTDLIRNEIKSKKQLPINIYQIQTKYRDELRPRFGLMRGREFIMKDAYSFDVDEAGLDASYQNMYETYKRIFDRLHINYEIVLADTGAIGGTGSHQFMAISEVGESDIIYCGCGYAADQEKAESMKDIFNAEAEMLEIVKVSTPNVKTIDEVSDFLNVSKKQIAKSLVYVDMANDQKVVVLVRGDREVNEIKVVNALGIAEHELRLAVEREIYDLGSYEGFVGPVGLKGVTILVDEELVDVKNLVVGANEKDYHLTNVNFERDFNGQVLQLRKTVQNDLCPVCGKPLSMERGIEVGQIFKLGTKYSLPMNCSFQNDNNKLSPMVMGCYGIGVTRTMAAIIEQYHDERGIKWPINVAPYHAVVVPVNYKDEVMREKSDEIYNFLKSRGVEVVLDDREYKPGFKFKDWELIGVPFMIVVGRRASESICEFVTRETLVKEELTIEEAKNKVVEKVFE